MARQQEPAGAGLESDEALRTDLFAWMRSGVRYARPGIQLALPPDEPSDEQRAAHEAFRADVDALVALLDRGGRLTSSGLTGRLDRPHVPHMLRMRDTVNWLVDETVWGDDPQGSLATLRRVVDAGAPPDVLIDLMIHMAIASTEDRAMLALAHRGLLPPAARAAWLASPPDRRGLDRGRHARRAPHPHGPRGTTDPRPQRDLRLRRLSAARRREPALATGGVGAGARRGGVDAGGLRGPRGGVVGTTDAAEVESILAHAEESTARRS